MAEIVPATSEMIKRLTDQPMPKTVRALAVVEGERVLGVTGFYPENGRLVIMAAIADSARAEMARHKRTLIRCAEKIMGMAERTGMPVYANADPEISGSDVLLKHLGFSHAFEGVYVKESL